MIYERFIDAADKTIDITTHDRTVRLLAKTIIRAGLLVFTVGAFLAIAIIGALAIGIIAAAWDLITLMWSN